MNTARVIHLSAYRCRAALLPEIMRLVEDAAEFLDCDGRRGAKALSSRESLAYSVEAMRLTTNLTRMALWGFANDGRDVAPELAEYPRFHRHTNECPLLVELMQRSQDMAVRIAAQCGHPAPDIMPKALPEPQQPTPRKSRSWLATFVHGWRKLIFRSEVA